MNNTHLSVFFIVSFYTNISCAHDPMQHGILSEIACLQVNKMIAEKNGQQLTKKSIKKIINSNKGEDTSVSLLANRAGNWHFYNSKKESSQYFDTSELDVARRGLFKLSGIISGTKGINRSFKKTVEKRIDGPLVSGEGDMFELIGKGQHFIQDSTNPAHISPVYHGPGTYFLNEKAIGEPPYGSSHKCKLADKFDGLTILANKIPGGDFTSAEIIEIENLASQVETSHKPVMMLVERNEQIITQLMKESPDFDDTFTAEHPVLKWEDFWGADIGKGYFKGYLNKEGEIIAFGDAEKTGIKPESFNSFQDKCNREAIKSSVALSLGIMKRYKDSENPRQNSLASTEAQPLNQKSVNNATDYYDANKYDSSVRKKALILASAGLVSLGTGLYFVIKHSIKKSARTGGK